MGTSRIKCARTARPRTGGASIAGNVNCRIVRFNYPIHEPSNEARARNVDNNLIRRLADGLPYDSQY